MFLVQGRKSSRFLRHEEVLPWAAVEQRMAVPGSCLVVRGMGRVLTLPDTLVWRGWAVLCFLPSGLWLRLLPEAVPDIRMEEWDCLPLLFTLQKGA